MQERISEKKKTPVMTILIVLALTLATLQQSANAQEQFSYMIEDGKSALTKSASSFIDAHQKLNAALGTPSARFTLESVRKVGNSIVYKYKSTPYQFVFWNSSHFNCWAYDGTNPPAVDDFNILPALIKEKSAKLAAANPAMCGAFNDVTIKSGVLYSPGYPALYPYKVNIEISVGSGQTQHLVSDQIKGFQARGTITRNLIPMCTAAKGNPIDCAHGAKLAFEADYTAPPFLLKFERAYNSQQPSLPGGMGNKGSWHHSFERALLKDLSVPNQISAFRFNFDMQFFAKGSDGVWKGGSYNNLSLYEEKDDSIGSTYRLFDSIGNLNEYYDDKGKLLAIKGINDDVFLTYGGTAAGYYPSTAIQCKSTADVGPEESGQLLCVTDRFGRQLNFAYDENGALSAMTDPEGNAYQYEYDKNGNLIRITYPDGLRRMFHYNETEFTEGEALPNALTGVSEEDSPGLITRYATYRYNSLGFAISTEHAGGIEKYVMNYEQPYKQSSVTEPLGSNSVFQFAVLNGYLRVSKLTRSCVQCAGTFTSNFSYDANGNVTSHTDFNGSKTTYSHDLSRNLETKRVEGDGTPEARTINTEWHPVFRLASRVAEPKRITTNMYDAKGNLLEKRVQSTTDENGAKGFNAEPVGAAVVVSYTYNDFNQMLTATDPRGGVTTYSYDTAGNLTSVTNAEGHVTSLSDYDANGRVGRIVDPNGLVTHLTYSPRGWLTSKKAGEEMTRYDYDGVGQLTKVTLADGSHVTYTYDDAHRLTAIVDSLGNGIVYTLDPMGNRVSEQVRDPEGALTRQTTRVYDALNRLQQITGAIQ
jgi:YD repeat-containing protein